MKQPSKATAADLFQGRRHYEIPAYQRPYVWNEEDQWAPLWDDVRRISESHLVESSRPLDSHFLGAVVLELIDATSTGVQRFSVIDGQQRLTTFQLLLDAARHVLAVAGYEADAELLEELVRNGQSRFDGTPHRFKLWPARTNREEFASVMTTGIRDPETAGQIQAAHDYFTVEARRWIDGEADADGERPPGQASERASELASTLANRLMVVSIDLTGDDDAQLIFETLNDRGTPLLKADLIKNWVFQQGQKVGADVERWSHELWDDFDTDWWRAETTQGRLSRSRVDIFLHYWLTMRLREEIRTDDVFPKFRTYAAPRMETPEDAEKLLTELRVDADTYRGMGALGEETAAGRFRARVVEAMELAGTTPVFLHMISPNHEIPENQVEVGLSALESWVVRRALLRMNPKDLNKLIVALLKSLSDVPPEEMGSALHTFLSRQTAPSREWPSDEQFVAEVASKRLYGNVKQNRIAVVLRAIEQYKRDQDPKYGDIALPRAMSIEHVMPRKWREHWQPEEPLTIEEEQVRNRAIHTLGNLTLIPQSLNSSLSNRPWTDADAEGLALGGKPGRGKWSILNEFNLQVLNKEILEHQDSWDERDIADRSKGLARVITRIWRGPDESVKNAADASRGGVVTIHLEHLADSSA